VKKLHLFALTALLASGLIRLQADDTTANADAYATFDAPPPVTTSTSHLYSEVTCTTSDTLACADTLQMAEDARLQLTPLLKLGPEWRFPVHIHVMTPDDPLRAKINREAAAVFADQTGMHIEAVLPSDDPDARAFIQRQFVTAILWEKFFANTRTFDGHTQLTVVPVWLVEGLGEWLNDDSEHNRESIVRKAVQSKTAPTLTDIAGWKEVSKDRLMGIWQRSFCFYLVNSITQSGPKRDNFQQWLTTLASPHPEAAQRLFPTEMGWQRELVDATQRSRAIVYTWDETLSELTTTEVITVPGSKQTSTLDNVTSQPYSAALAAILQQKLTDLTSLELRAHPSWHSTLELYRAGLMAFITDKNSIKAQQFFSQAHAVRVAEMTNHQKMVDYVNWFEVTRDYPGTVSRFNSYFNTAKALEQVQADPAHPNPIRADLLHVESQSQL
jgi:hypothetical protein